MANDDFAQGLRPINWKTDTLPVHVYEAASSGAGGVIFMGMPVAQVAAGLVANAAQVGGAGTNYLGVAVGFLGAGAAGPVSDSLPHLDTGGTARRYVIVADDPDQEFLIQENTNATVIVNADRGAGVDMIYRSTSGNTTTGWANLEVDGSSVLATGTGALIFLRFQDGTNSDGTAMSSGNYAKLIVRINNHQRRGQPVTITAV